MIAAGALAFRLPSLGNRPMHGDEAVHAAKLDQIWHEGSYRYDPNEYHGPTLYYSTFPVLWLRHRATFAATTEADYRLVTALYGAGLVLIAALVADGLGWGAVLAAGVLLALSPALVFYSRYYIQETLLAFLTLAAIGCGWRFTRSQGTGWLVACGACAGLMVATKETAFLAFVAAAAGLLVARRAAGSRSPGREGEDGCASGGVNLPASGPSAVRPSDEGAAAGLPVSTGGVNPPASGPSAVRPSDEGGPADKVSQAGPGPGGVNPPASGPSAVRPSDEGAPARTAPAARPSDEGGRVPAPRGQGRVYPSARACVWAGVAFVLGWALPLTGGFAHPGDALGVFRSLAPWMQRAGGTDLHGHSPWYYLGLLAWTHRARGPVWSEALILVLAAIGIGVAFAGRHRGRIRADATQGQRGMQGTDWRPDTGLLRFLAVFTLVLVVGYSAVPYKTPWCILSFLVCMALLGGVGALALLRWTPTLPGKALVGLALAGAAAQLGWQAYFTSFIHYADPRNPYVYAQPVPDVVEFGKRVTDLAASSRQGDRMVVQIISGDNYYWPLPWYLRRLQNVGYYTSVPQGQLAPVVLSSPQFDEELTKRLDPTHLMTGYYGIRPATVMQVWVSMDVWQRYLASHRPPSSR